MKYFPASVLLQKLGTAFSLSPSIGLAIPLIGLAWFVLAYAIRQRGLRHYKRGPAHSIAYSPAMTISRARGRARLQSIALLAAYLPIALVIGADALGHPQAWWLQGIALVLGAGALLITLDRMASPMRAIPTGESPFHRDDETLLLDRESAMTALRARVEQAHQFAPLCVALVDLEAVQNGGADLADLGKTIRAALRAHDWAARYGDRIFLLALENGPQAGIALERLRATLGTKPEDIVVGYAITGRGDTIDDVLERSESALRRAHALGGNVVVAVE